MDNNEEKLPAVKPAVGIGPVSGGLVPTTFDGLYRMAQIMSASGMMPKGIERPEAVFVAVQMGLEIGLSPMQAVQNIAVINGRPSLWGDSVLGLVRASGKLERFSETIDGAGDKMAARCLAKRKGEPDEIVREFSVDDAKKANLWGKPGPWQQYPKRMLQMRARSWALRDGFGDVIKGLRVAEEVIDYDVDMSVTGQGQWEPEQQTEHKPDPAAALKPLYEKHGRIVVDQYLRATADRYGVGLGTLIERATASEKSMAEMTKDFESWKAKQDEQAGEPDPDRLKPTYTARNSPKEQPALPVGDAKPYEPPKSLLDFPAIAAAVDACGVEYLEKALVALGFMGRIKFLETDKEKIALKMGELADSESAVE